MQSYVAVFANLYIINTICPPDFETEMFPGSMIFYYRKVTKAVRFILF